MVPYWVMADASSEIQRPNAVNSPTLSKHYKKEHMQYIIKFINEIFVQIHLQMILKLLTGVGVGRLLGIVEV